MWDNQTFQLRMTLRREFWILAGIVLLGAVLRLWNLGKNPPGLYWDEVSLGWNAYSVLKTGMDEHGRFLPLDTFYAFGDYKPPGYIYVTVPSIAFFGLNEFAVRLPSAMAGIGLIILTYFLVKELQAESGKRKAESSRSEGSDLSERSDPSITNHQSRITGLIASFLVAISPWSIQLSRVAFESNLAVLFNALGVLFFLYAVRKSPRWLFASVTSFVLATYTFNANRLLSPLLLVALTLIFLKTAVKNWKYWGCSGILGVLLVLPMVPHLASTQGKVRWNEVNIFSDLSVIEESNARKELDGNTLLSRVLHHRYLGYGRLFLARYLDHFDFNYLFLKGDPNPRINVPGMGQLYVVELPFFLIGLIGLISQIGPIWSKGKLVIFLWALLAPIPASLARETPHALRTASILPVPQILVAMGVVWVVKVMREKKKLFVIGYSLLVIGSLFHFLFVYHRYYPYEWATEWLTSYPRLVREVNRSMKSGQSAYITPDLGRPYIYFLFYSQYPPERFIEEAKAGGRTGDAFGFFEVREFGNIRFFVPEPHSIRSGSIVVTRTDPVPDGFELLNSIDEVNGRPTFNILEKK